MIRHKTNQNIILFHQNQGVGMVVVGIAFALVGGLFVAETLSVILQVSYFRWTGGKRIFRMAPLHHHFELKGVPESKIIIRFWITSILLGLLALSVLKLR